MRIGIDIRALMENRMTGVQVYIKNLLEALFKIDRENEYVLFANSFTPPLIPFLNEGGRERRWNVEYRIFRYPNKLFIPAQKHLHWPKIDKLLGGIDLFFSPHWRMAALSPGIPLVITFHDLSFEVMPNFFTLRQRLWHKFMDYRGAARKASKIIAVSESTKQDLARIYNISQAKIEVIYSGVEPLQVANHSSPEKYFLYLGTFEPRKNLEAVLVAYQKYCDSSEIKRPLVLAGSSGWKTNLHIPPKLRNQIKLRQSVSEEEKAFLYQNAFALLFLSYYEGFGFPVLEAASAGAPVISSFATSLAEIAGSFALLVNPFRPSQVAAAMLALEEDEKLYQSLRNKGLQAAKEFTWKKTAKQTLELFTKLCALE